MKKLLLFFATYCLLSTGLQAQCPSGRIELNTQAEVNAFPTNYPGCTELPGDLTIRGGSIVDLSPLSILESIGGYLEIRFNGSLTSLSGLEALSSVGGTLLITGNNSLVSLTGLEGLSSVGNLTISSNNALTSLSALDGLTSVVGNLRVTGNNSLVSLTGLEGFSSVGGLTISSNDALTSLSALDGLTSVGGTLFISRNDALASLSGLEGISSVGSLSISRSDALTSLSGLDGLTSVGQTLSITFNDALTSLSGLDGLTSVGGTLSIQINSSLTSLSSLAGISSVGGDISITFNDALTSLSGLDGVSAVGGNLSISFNDALTSLSVLAGLTSVGGALRINNNNSLVSLTGLEGISAVGGDLFIGSNSSLVSLTALAGISSMVGSLGISSNSSLVSLTGLEGISSVGGYLNIQSNDALTSLSGLDGLTSVGGTLFIVSNDALTSLTTLAGISSVGGDLYIFQNSSLTNLAGLDGISSVGGNLSIRYSSLTSLAALDGLSSVGGDLDIRFNSSLTTCSIDAVCDKLDDPNASISISNNATGCNTEAEILDNCGPSLGANCQNATVALQSGGQVTITASQVDNGSIGATSMSVSPSTFSCSDLGANMVTLTVMDGSNSDDCTATITVQDGVGLPGGWDGTNIGVTNPSGNGYNFTACNTTSTNDEFTIAGSGNNATSSMTDNVAFASQTLCGDGSITAKIESVGASGYGGLMIRENAAAGSKMVAVYSNMSSQLRYESRSMTNAPKSVQSFFKPSPIWLRITRQGMWIHTEYSSNGMSFQPVQSTMLSMQSCVEIGLASFTYLPMGQTEATFSNVSTTGNIQSATGGSSTTFAATPPTEQHHHITASPYHDINIFPNPTNAHFTLALDTPLEQDTPVEIINLYGHVIASQILPAGTLRQEWETMDWAAGTYMLRIQTGQAPMVKQFVVIR